MKATEASHRRAQSCHATEQMHQRTRVGQSHLTQPIEVASNRAALLRRPTVEALVGYSKSTIYDKVRSGTFPAPIILSSRCARWRAGDVIDWLEAQGGQA